MNQGFESLGRRSLDFRGACLLRMFDRVKIVAFDKIGEVCRWVGDKSRNANVTNEVVEVDGFGLVVSKSTILLLLLSYARSILYAKPLYPAPTP